MKKRIYIAEKIPPHVEEFLAVHTMYEKWEGPGKIPRHVLLERIRDKHGLLNFGAKIDRELLEAAPELEVVSNISVGYDNWDMEEMNTRGIIGTNTPYVLDDTVADLVFGLMLAAARRICELDQLVKTGGWEKEITPQHYGVDVHHATIGIVGMGRIGEAIAKRAALGFDMNVLYYNRSRKPEAEEAYGAVYCGLDDLLRQADFIVLMTPLTPETRHMIGAREFHLMKQSAIFINASRGQTVDEAALLQALQQRRILAAGIDTFEVEPIAPDNPLLQLSNIVTLPHIGSATIKTRQQMAMTAAENLVAALQGEQAPYAVNIRK